MAINSLTIPMRGGLNVAVSDHELAAGECSILDNYEITVTGRYSTTQGYERTDGSPLASQVVIADLPGFPFDDISQMILAVLSAQAVRRQQILPVPGTGPVLGVFQFSGVLYAFRDNESGTKARLCKATNTGWQLVSTPELAPGGRYEFVDANFAGSSGTAEVIGVDGKNKAFRFNGTSFVQITSPMPIDQPTHAAVLASQVLLLSFRGGSLLFSGVGEPTKFSPVDGGGEIAVGQEIAAIAVQADATTAILCRNKTFMLYGSSKQDFQLKLLADRAGAIVGSIQTMGASIYMDDRGLTRLERVQQFGDFDAATISQKVEPILSYRLNDITCSLVLRAKNQYRIYFADNTALCVTFAGAELVGFSTLSYPTKIVCAWSGEDQNGKEVAYAGGADGYVYKLNSGNSFDGLPILTQLQTGFMSFGSPEQKKRWHKLVLEAESVTQVQTQTSVFYDFADPNVPLADLMLGSGSKWDMSQWDLAVWGGSSVSWTDQYISGVSRNIAINIQSSTDFYPPHIISQMFIHASPRGRRR
jgi:hypothetical protein